MELTTETIREIKKNYDSKENGPEKKQAFIELIEASLNTYEATKGKPIGEGSQMSILNIANPNDQMMFTIIAIQDHQDKSKISYTVLAREKSDDGSRYGAVQNTNMRFVAETGPTGNKVTVENDNPLWDIQKDFSNAIASFATAIIEDKITYI